MSVPHAGFTLFRMVVALVVKLLDSSCAFMSLEHGSLHKIDWRRQENAGTDASQRLTKCKPSLKTHPLAQFQTVGEFSPKCFSCVKTYYYFILANYKTVLFI